MRASLIPTLAAYRPRCDVTFRGAARWLRRLPGALPAGLPGVLPGGTPHEVSMGVAVGMFVAVTPTPGAQILFAAALAGAFRCSVRAAVVMTFFSNPITGLPLNAIAYALGQPFCPSSPALSWGEFSAAFVQASATWSGMLALGERLLLPLVIGSILLGLVLAPLSYLAARLACRMTQATPVVV